MVHLPRFGWNRWANQTDAPCRILAIFAPAGFEQYFLELSAALAGSAITLTWQRPSASCASNTATRNTRGDRRPRRSG